MVAKKTKTDWMEVDAINTQWTGKGHDSKGKGKGKEGGKGGNATRWCHNCKSTTHDTKFCWAGKAGKAGKGGKAGKWKRIRADQGDCAGEIKENRKPVLG